MSRFETVIENLFVKQETSNKNDSLIYWDTDNSEQIFSCTYIARLFSCFATIMAVSVLSAVPRSGMKYNLLIHKGCLDFRSSGSLRL